MTCHSTSRLRFLAALAAAALALRLWPVLHYGRLSIGADMRQYDMLARSLAAGHGYRWYVPAEARYFALELAQFGLRLPIPDDPRGVATSFRAPLYPLFLSLVYRFTSLGDRFFVARVVQAVVGATLPLLTYALGLAADAGERSSRLAGGLVAGYSLLILYPLGLVTENLFIPLFTGFLAALLWAARAGRARRALLAGCLGGLAALTRSLVAVTWPVAIWWLWRSQTDLRRRALVCAALSAGLLAFTVPWSVRNSRLHNRAVWLESSLGYVLYLGYHPASTGTVRADTTLDLLPILDDMQRHDAGLRAALAFIHADPLRAAKQIGLRLPAFWGLEWRELIFFYGSDFFGAWPPWLLALALLWLCLPLTLLLPAAIYGWLTGSALPARWLFLGVALSLMLAHMLTMAEARYHLPLAPLLAVLAGQGLTAGPRPRAARIAALVYLPFVLLWGVEAYQNAARLAVLFAPGGNRSFLGY